MSRTVQKGERAFTVSALLISNDEQEPRALLRFHPKLGYWLPPGGHIELTEDPIIALIREFKEEVGIDLTSHLKVLATIDHVQVLPLPSYLLSIHAPADKPNPGDPEHYFLDLMYVIRMPCQKPRKGSRAEWIPKRRLSKYPAPANLRYFLREQMQ